MNFSKPMSKVLLLTVATLFFSSLSLANTIWGRITGLGGYGATNYIGTVRITTDRNEVFYGRAQYLQGPGLIWTANVPSITRNYRVEVTAIGEAANVVRWNPEIAYGYWAWFRPSTQCNDIRFWLK